jgi:hypothetical protein
MGLTQNLGLLSTAIKATSTLNVGIGTNSPDGKLHIYGKTYARYGQDDMFAFYYDDNYRFGITNPSTDLRQLRVFGKAADGNSFLVFATGNDTERMRITSGGNVGIGTSSPSAILHTSVTTNGTSVGALFANPNQAGTADAVTINFGLGRTTDAFLFSIPAIKFGKEQQWTSTGSTVDGYLSFSTMLNESVSERMRITSGGSVGIGTAGSSDARFTVAGLDATSSNYSVVFNNNTTTMFFLRNDGYMYFGLSSNSPYNLGQSGRTCILASNGTVGYLVSTRESKANIESIKNVDFINQLNPVQFNYRKKDDKTNTFTDEVEDNITYGFIADEVEKINKELVFYNSDNTTLAGVDYNSIIAILTKAVQELKAEIDALKNK